MKTLDNLRRKLESVGATMEEFDCFVVCDSPSGYVWRSTGGTALTIRYRNVVGQSWLAEELRREMPNLKMGLCKITDTKQLDQWRWDLGDDTWGASSDAPEIIEFPK